MTFVFSIACFVLTVASYFLGDATLMDLVKVGMLGYILAEIWEIKNKR